MIEDIRQLESGIEVLINGKWVYSSLIPYEEETDEDFLIRLEEGILYNEQQKKIKENLIKNKITQLKTSLTAKNEK